MDKHWSILTRSPDLTSIVGPRPLLVSRRAKNLKYNLVHSEFTRSPSNSWQTNIPHSKGMFPCGHCHICRHVECTDKFTNVDDNKVYQIQQFINCSTEKVLYILQCPCKKIYFGKTKRQLRICIGEHLCSIRNIQKSKDKDNLKWGPIAQHFEKFYNSSVDGLKIKGFFALCQIAEEIMIQSFCGRKRNGSSVYGL